jgi:hypothetical protein
MSGYITNKDKAGLSNVGNKGIPNQTSLMPTKKGSFEKILFNYFKMLVKAGILDIELSDEAAFTLEQFLTGEYLSVKKITDKLENTEFEAEYENVGKKFPNLLAKGLIVKKTKYFKKLPSKNDINYRLTSLGIFYSLCNRKQDASNNLFKFYNHWSKKEDDASNNLFKNYEDDTFFEIFTYPIINKETIAAISSIEILRVFIDYATQICSEIIKELKVVGEIVRKGYYEVPCFKWKPNRKKDNIKWLSSLSNSLSSIFPVPYPVPPGFYRKPTDQTYLIKQLDISHNSLSFLLDDRKYCLVLDKENNQVIPYIDDKEIGGASNRIRRTRVEPKSDGYMIYSVKYKNRYDYIKNLGPKFRIYLGNLEFQLGLSILKLFYIPSLFAEAASELNKDDSLKIYRNDLEILSKDEKIKKLINKVNGDIQQHYKDFLKYCQ